MTTYNDGGWINSDEGDALTDRMLAEITPEEGKVTYVHDGRDWVVSVAGPDGRMLYSATEFWFHDSVMSIKRQQEADSVRPQTHP